ncbi:probable G- coupled receptor Mth-like 1 [Paramuricea clavata]|uniref:Probable G- coupled receptor Mth-like 1 n=1 Tax=Paramuricea clavata TaxID=317549 RepID=A0A6S7K9E0_PARCT|nr:probable G- coupled receptor Mth-like 1 [Paramuricea clavata]
MDNLSNILFFKVPVGIALGLNIIAFIWTILGITNVRNKTSKYNSTKNQQTTVTKDVKMYGKLSVVMGLTWTLGFAMEYSVIVKFIFLIVNSLQGFFIFLAFVTNKRVMEKCKMSRPSWSQSASSNSRKTSSGSSVGLNTRKISYGNS